MAFWALAVVCAWGRSSFYFPSKPILAHAAAAYKPSLAGTAAVLPFVDVKVPDLGSATNQNNPTSL